MELLNLNIPSWGDLAHWRPEAILCCTFLAALLGGLPGELVPDSPHRYDLLLEVDLPEPPGPGPVHLQDHPVVEGEEQVGAVRVHAHLGAVDGLGQPDRP